ncbi:outer membrane scaffolding protein for murein synthesis (MipA/OmpV family) [Chitinivorax tropicus]|uniref:Outer membrane scaffolding protein for murein synthesis (MipA/OmpV family) n=1 Tax=Chitinivorax tropicus TaxID=714531 RepID=A0A840MBN3_9PROT|nr:MipA/OmpV family protein [Chitinivorax tropicus]MBB5016744.1 outer membrane scaffolding protein for murein synthesis (MipA/OmpV family) [Chitinivorax tropicus]
MSTLRHNTHNRPTTWISRLGLALCMAGGMNIAWADDWSLTTDLGVAVGHRYPGGKETVTSPLIGLTLKAPMGFFIGTQSGLGWGTDIGKRASVAVYLAASPGRKDHRARFEGSDYLKGMGDIKSRAQLGFNAKVELGMFELESTLAFTDKGSEEQYIDLNGKQQTARQEGSANLRLSLGTQFYEGKWGTLAGAVLTDFGDSHYMMNWFGVNPLQASRTQFKAYTPSAGMVDLGASLAWIVPLDKQTTLTFGGEALRLVGDAADSPIVLKKNQFSGTAALSYTF